MKLQNFRLIILWLLPLAIHSFSFSSNQPSTTRIRCTRHISPESSIHQSRPCRSPLAPLKVSENENSEKNTPDDDDVQLMDKENWRAQQQALAMELFDASERARSAESRKKFAKRRLSLLGDTAYIGMFIFCFLWLVNDNPFVSISYAFGGIMGLAYAYGLGKFVENIGGSIDDEASSRGAGVGEARFAFLILLFIFVGKFRAQGLQELPAITGFFTYQVASVFQGIKDLDDD